MEGSKDTAAGLDQLKAEYHRGYQAGKKEQDDENKKLKDIVALQEKLLALEKSRTSKRRLPQPSQMKHRQGKAEAAIQAQRNKSPGRHKVDKLEKPESSGPVSCAAGCSQTEMKTA